MTYRMPRTIIIVMVIEFLIIKGSFHTSFFSSPLSTSEEGQVSFSLKVQKKKLKVYLFLDECSPPLCLRETTGFLRHS